MPAANSTGDSSDAKGTDAFAVDSREWLRDMGALLALPAMWMDHSPADIATGLLSVLGGVLQPHAAYARFDGTDGADTIEVWWPTTSAPAPELIAARQRLEPEATGTTTTIVEIAEGDVRVASMPVALPWETSLVLVSSRRENFPTAIESHLLRVAVGQAVVAFHTARRLAREQHARHVAEARLQRSDALIRAVTEDIEPALSSLSHKMRNLIQTASEHSPGPVGTGSRSHQSDEASESPQKSPPSPSSPSPSPRLSRRETEVLGLLAQGLSNKEIAGVLWLSDRTVERHITSLYRKIGVARRSEATVFALHHLAE